MTRGVWAALVLFAVGLAGSAAAQVETLPAPRPAVPPLLTPEAAPDLTPEPTPAGRRAPRPRYPEGYEPPRDEGMPAPTRIPDLPMRKPARVAGDPRFLEPGSAGGIALSPDGTRLALGSCVFDSATGRLDTAYDPETPVDKLVMSPDGTRLYCGGGTGDGSFSGRLVVRDVPGRRQLLSIPAGAWSLSRDGRRLVAVQFVRAPSPRGRRDFRAHFYPAIRIYDTASWGCVAAYRVRGAGPTAVALSPDGGRMVIGCGDGTVRVWDHAVGEEVAVLRELSATPIPTRFRPVVRLLAFSPDGATLAAASRRPDDRDNECQVAWWRWPDGTPLHVRTCGRDPTDLCFSPDGAHLFCGSTQAYVWDARSGRQVGSLSLSGAQRRGALTVAFAGADRVYASGAGRPGLLHFPSLRPLPWPDPAFDDSPKPPFALAGAVPTLDTLQQWRSGEIRLPNGSRLRRPDGGGDGVQLVDRAGNLVRHFEEGWNVTFDATPDGRLLAAVPQDPAGQASNTPLRFWNLATGAEVAALWPFPRPDAAVHFSPDGKRLAVRHVDGLVRVWDVAARKPILALDPDGYWPWRLAYSKDGRFLVAGVQRSPVLVVWDVTNDGGG